MAALDNPTIINILHNGEIKIKGEFMWGSNYTFLAEVSQNGTVIQTVYKPSRGEQPLWDFPPASLALREAAAYLVSEALGWELVPPTVFRRKAPIGPGSLQLYIEHDPELHYFSLDDSDRQLLRPVVLFDLLINNADRKGSHLLFDDHHHLWLIDHGICFHSEDKLRTVIWDFVDEPIPGQLLDDLKKFRRELDRTTLFYKDLHSLINTQEINAMAQRADRLITLRRFPQPNPNERSLPWPPI